MATKKGWTDVPEHVNYVRYTRHDWRERTDGYLTRALETGFGFSTRLNEDKVVGLLRLLDEYDRDLGAAMRSLVRAENQITELEEKLRQYDYAGAVKPKKSKKKAAT